MTFKNKKSKDNRKYTLMIVPHQGKSTVFRLRIPIQAVKYIAVMAGIFFIAVITAMLYYGQEIHVASSEKGELENLRQVNVAQKKQIEELSHKTNTLQADMNRLNQLEVDIKKMINAEDEPQTSRSSDRPTLGFNGKGGPEPKLQLEQISSELQSIQNNLPIEENNLMSLKEILIEKRAKQAYTPSIWPARGDVTSRFGGRSSPFGGGSDYHPGIDIANEAGTPILAAADGIVVYSGWNNGGYGNLVQIDHGNGIETLYGHCSTIVVQVGQQIHKGDLIAYMGSTGLSTGSHVHYEVRVNGTAVNPESFLNH